MERPLVPEKNILQKIIPALGLKYRADMYDLILQNENHFTDELIFAITEGQSSLPSYLNRTARLAYCFTCIIPIRYR